MAKRPAFGPLKGENMAARPRRVHGDEQMGLRVLNDGGGVDRLVVQWQGKVV